MLTKNEVKTLREELDTAKNPLFFYDDDPDGLCSFLLLYRIHRLGKGVIVKAAPKVDAKFLRKVEENNPEKIFILDIPIVEQDFVNEAKKPIFWIDHHDPLKVKNVKYYNPRKKKPDIYLPTSRMAYQIANNKNDLWLATVGCLADWHMPNFIDEFIEKYPELLPEKKDLNDAVYQQPIGKLVRIFSFLLKGQLYEVNKCIKILSRIKSPDEILEQKTSQGKFLYKRFKHVDEKYQNLIKTAKKKVTKSKLLLFFYTENQWSFTADLANELTNLYPDKVVLIARNKSGKMKCSLRAKFPIKKALEKALVGIDGYGGGHENACGTVVDENDWDKFLKKFKKEIK